MNMMIPRDVLALMLKRLGGKFEVNVHARADMGGGRYEIRQFKTFDPEAWTWELVDHEAPVEETLTVVEDVLALPAPTAERCRRCGRTEAEVICCMDC